MALTGMPTYVKYVGIRVFWQTSALNLLYLPKYRASKE